MDHGCFLSHAATAEVCILQNPLESNWQLGFDARGFGFVAGSGCPTTWVSKLFQHHVYQDGSAPAAEMVRVREGLDTYSMTPLGELGGRRLQDVTLAMDLAPFRAFHLTLAVWHLPQAGARCWHYLNALYASLGLTAHKGTPSRWIGHGWRAWSKLCSDMGLPAVHVANGMPWCSSGMQDVGTQPGSGSSVLLQRSVSSHMLLALLCRWGSTSQRLGFFDEADRVAARNMLGLLLAMVAAQHPAFQIKWQMHLGPRPVCTLE